MNIGLYNPFHKVCKTVNLGKFFQAFILTLVDDILSPLFLAPREEEFITSLNF